MTDVVIYKYPEYFNYQVQLKAFFLIFLEPMILEYTDVNIFD